MAIADRDTAVTLPGPPRAGAGFSAVSPGGASARVPIVRKDCHALLRVFAQKFANCAEWKDSLVDPEEGAFQFPDRLAVDLAAFDLDEGGLMRPQSRWTCRFSRVSVLAGDYPSSVTDDVWGD